MTNYNAPIAQLAAIAFSAYYSNDDSLDSFRDYLDADDMPLDMPNLADALCDDIRDLLHNANLADLFPFSNDLSDDNADRLARRFHDDFDQLTKLCSAIATIMLATDPLPYR